MKVAAPITVRDVLTIACLTAAFLLVPLIGMQLSDEVNWTAFDFLIAGALLFGTGVIYLLLVKKAPTKKYRAFTTIAVVGAMIVIWIELAVGIFD